MLGLAIRLIPMLFMIVGFGSLTKGCDYHHPNVPVEVLEEKNEELAKGNENCNTELTRAQRIIRECECYCPENFFPDGNVDNPIDSDGKRLREKSGVSGD